jgi:hypothetical protein
MVELNVEGCRAELDGNYCLVLTSNTHEKEAVKAVTTCSMRAGVGQATAGAYLGPMSGRLVLHVSGHSGVSKDQSIGRIASAFLRNGAMPKLRLRFLVGFCWGNPRATHFPLGGWELALQRSAEVLALSDWQRFRVADVVE